MAKPQTPTNTGAKVVDIPTPAPVQDTKTDTTAPAQTPEPEPEKPEQTSPALVELRAKEESLQDAIFAAGKGKKAMELMMELWEVQKSITNEKANIVKAQRELEIETAKNQRIAKFDNAVALAIASHEANKVLLAIPLDVRTPDDIAAANTANAAYQTERESIVNELLAKYGSSTAAKKTGEPATGGAKGKSAEVLDLIKPLYAEGKSGAEVRAAVKMHGGQGAWGYFNDGTANAVILAYEKENHLNGK